MAVRRSDVRQLQRWRGILEIAALVIVIVSGSLLAFYIANEIRRPQRGVVSVPPQPQRAARPTPPLPSSPISISEAHGKGSPDARVAILEFAEPQCPYCVEFHRGASPGLAEKYVSTGKVKFIYWHFPIESIHSYALKASEAAECAGEQGRFWEMHDSLLENHRELAEPSLHDRATRLGLDSAKFAACLDGMMTEKVRRLVSEAQGFGVSGTPTFFIGTIEPDGRLRVVERLTGAQPLARFSAILDKLIGETD